MRYLFLLISVFYTMLSCHAQDEARKALDEAREFTREGKYKEALERHIWFHNHALEKEPSYYGVRLSFALSDWVALGRKYPEALDALKKIRDEKTARLVAGEDNRPLFHDVESINSTLGDWEATVELFRKLDAARPAFAASVVEMAGETLVEAGEFGLVKKHMGDPDQRFDEAKSGYERGLEHAKTSTVPDAARGAHERIFSGEVVRIITVLDKTGDKGKAAEIQKKALAVLDSPAIRDALNP
ncbi:hypothetical protein OVA24_14570 [Luteolibacter sp. SL250]|uniref:hypothetical protein n=1 Tax=Luteolibacter sp. SL250 TaxID=2995170 RepID=UPI00226F4470|nr:hypothetical protein [Luteolibacter sp. SL250]WAC18456.1 hypothetical protein OVA24_14570 [Luteolibacter sp. SL250]